MKAFATFLLCLAAPSVLGALSKQSEAPLNNPLPFPFAPPSDDFCDSNLLGDDAYLSFFVPCEFTFFAPDDSSKPHHFSCDPFNDSDVIKSEARKVMMWPDSCVAAGERCYSIIDHPDLYNFTLFEGTDYAMEFPPEATVVSVDCTADFAKAQEFMANLPSEMEDVASAISFAAFVFLVAVIAAIIACICCCCGVGRRRDSARPQPYVTIPNQPWIGEPVLATAYQGQPAFAAAKESV